MRAAQITKYGDVNVVTLSQNVVKPSVENGKVLVEIHAASLNPVDTIIRMGYMHQMAPLQFPATLGLDIAGVVVEEDPAGGALKAGDRIFGTASALAGNSGAFAEYASVTVGTVAKIPENLGFTEAASLPLAGVSALQALVETLKLSKGSKILILGGSGGIGTYAIQIAKQTGARVIATCRTSAIDYVKSLGADQVIDFEKGPFPGSLRDIDAVFDTAGGAAYKSSFSVLKKGGTSITMAGQPDSELAAKYGVTALGQMTNVTTARLESLSRLVSNGSVKAHVDRVFSLDNVKEAFIAREAGHVKGKIVLSIK